MNLNEFTEFSVLMLKEALFGLSFVTIILLVNSTLVLSIYLRFNAYCHRDNRTGGIEPHIQFGLSLLLICLTELLSIIIWAVIIYTKGLVSNLTMAALFAGSCFTTLGIYSDTLPAGWRFIALYIGFSGLFSFAMATSALMAMIMQLSKKLGAKI